MTRERVVITGLGFVTPIGNDREAVRASLKEGRHGLGPVNWFPNCAVKVAGTIKEFETDSVNPLLWKFPGRYDLKRETIRSTSPHGLYAHCAMEQAIADAGLTPADVSNHDTGLFCASAGSPRNLTHHVNDAGNSLGQRISPWGVVASIAGTLNFNLAAHFLIQGSVTGFVSACAASSHALGYATDEISLGRQKRMFVVGAEEPVWESLLPFNGMRALSRQPDPDLASRPFDRQRDGFVGSGGAATVVLENLSDALARGAPIYAEIIGWGQTADGYNIASPEPTGRGIERAMRRALASAGIEPGQVDYVNAHATSTPAGDRAESAALARVFGEGKQTPFISSTKGLTGHTLSMAGALETALCSVALKDQFIPGTAGLVETDVDAPKLNLPRTTLDERYSTVLKNSSGFGGSNVCLVLRRWEA